MSASIAGRAFLRAFTVAAATTASSVGCSGTSPSTGRDVGPSGVESTGTIGLAITLPGGEAIETIAYSIQGPTAYAGTVDVSGTSSTFRFVIPGIAPGSGYTITLTATTTDGSVACEGTSSPFDVLANQTTAVNVLLACTTTAEAGAVLVDGTGFDCATWHTAIANPATAKTGESVSLVAWASAPDPSAITYQWSATAGTFADATSASTTFTCPSSPGDVPVTLTVGDGPVPQGATCPAASSTTTITVSCQSAVSLVASCSAWCSDPAHAHFDALTPRDTRYVTFTITNEGTSPTAPLSVTQGGDADFNSFGSCENASLAPGASCTVSYGIGCSGGVQRSSFSFAETTTISDPSGASTTVGIDGTCYCSFHGGGCAFDSDCCESICSPRGACY